jgi:hypothetical protein
MRLVASIVAAAIVAAGSSASPGILPEDRIWFAPGAGTVDMLRLFEAPQEWTHARAVIDVFQFYQGHALTQGGPLNGPNRYDAFVQVNAFRQLRQWGKRVAMEVGVVKEFYCTEDDSGMRASIADTVDAVRNVEAAGGRVAYLSMDEPFISGRSARCGGPSLEPTANRLAIYMPAIKRAFPGIRIGLVEPYPFFRPEEFGDMLRLMRDRGIPPDFLHVDTEGRPSTSPGRERFVPDILQLSDLARSYQMPFGMLLIGQHGDADALYAADVRRNTENLAVIFLGWEFMPQHIVIQSFAESRTGQFITPSNLPESSPDTHTALVNEVYHRLRTAANLGGRRLR